MLSPQRPTNVDEQPTDLSYWVQRCCKNRKSSSEYHLLYQGCTMIVHPARGALVQKDGREVFVSQSPKYTGRGWLQNLVGDIEAAVTTLNDGGGVEIKETFGDLVRKEITRRKTEDRRVPEEREHWVEWLNDDELPIVLGAWLARVGIVGVHLDLSRKASVDFHPTNDEFETVGSASSPSIMWGILCRLALARGAPSE